MNEERLKRLLAHARKNRRSMFSIRLEMYIHKVLLFLVKPFGYSVITKNFKSKIVYIGK